MESRRSHWESVYRDNDDEQVGWYQADPALSFELIRECTGGPEAPIVNIGGGSSVLVDRLLDAGYTDVTVMDLAPTALSIAQERLGKRANNVRWIEGDVTEHHFESAYAVWHDRAVFHFLTDVDDQLRYVEQLRAALAAGGHAIIAAFALDGPERCSGLPVQRYGPESLSRGLGAGFEPLGFESETHVTPSGVTQEFIYGRFRRRAADGV